jgi:hypothetical protein
MDVGFYMKIISLIAILFFASVVQAEPLLIFGTKLEINPDCSMNAMDKNSNLKHFKLNLPESSNCKIINHSETNIIHLEQVANSYILLVESTSQQDKQCISKYTAIAIKSDGSVLPSDTSKISGTCNIGRERKVFEYFAHKMRLNK